MARATSTTVDAPGTTADQPAGATTTSTSRVPGTDAEVAANVDTTVAENKRNLPEVIRSRLPSEAFVTPTQPAAGETVTFERCGFEAGEAVRVYVGSEVAGRAVADAKGCVTAKVDIDKGASGRVEVALYAPDSKTGAKTVLGVRGRLAATGSNSSSTVFPAAFLGLVGAALVVASRRKRRST